MRFNLPLTSVHHTEVVKIYEQVKLQYKYPVGGNWKSKNFESDICNQEICGAFTDDGQLVAFICFHCHVESCDILKLAVAPSYERKGVMSQLLQSFMSSNGSKRYYVEVHEKNLGALEFYKKQGMTLRGERRNFYGPGESAYLLAIDL